MWVRKLSEYIFHMFQSQSISSEFYRLLILMKSKGGGAPLPARPSPRCETGHIQEEWANIPPVPPVFRDFCVLQLCSHLREGEFPEKLPPQFSEEPHFPSSGSARTQCSIPLVMVDMNCQIDDTQLSVMQKQVKKGIME
jgi:hypothetical protein